jgi:6-phosphogluconolactonase (cycloisomerase 2 family)
MRAWLLLFAFCVSCSATLDKKCRGGLLCDPQTLLNVLLLLPGISTKYVVSANSTGNSLSVFSVESATGALKQVSSITTGLSNPASIAYRPSTSHLFVVNTGSSTVSSYLLDMTTGSLLYVSSIALTTPAQISLDSRGNYAYVTTGPSGRVEVYSASANGVLSFLSQATTATVPAGIAMDPAGAYLLTSSTVTNQIGTFSIDTGTGALTAGSVAMPCASDVIALAPNGRTLFVGCTASNQIAALSVTAGGETTLIALTSTITTPRQLASRDAQTVVMAQQGLGFYNLSGSAIMQTAVSGTVVRNGVAMDYSGKFAWSSQAGSIETFSLADAGGPAVSSASASGGAGILLPVYGF